MFLFSEFAVCTYSDLFHKAVLLCCLPLFSLILPLSLSQDIASLLLPLLLSFSNMICFNINISFKVFFDI